VVTFTALQKETDVRYLTLFHLWDTDDVDAIGIIPEIVLEHADDAERDRMFEAFKAAYGVADEPDETFRTAWVTMPSGDQLFDDVDLGSAEMVSSEN